MKSPINIKGHTNRVCDYKSRFPAKKTEAPEINIRIPYISPRSRKVFSEKCDQKDPLVQRLVEIALEDMEYMQMISDIKNSTNSKDLKKRKTIGNGKLGS